MSNKKKFDAFISHASEDKDAFVRPLAIALQNLGVSVWFDEFELRVGDSLSRSIDRGLADSRFGIVVISQAFVSKKWPQRELQGLVARETDDDEHPVILPVWHGITRRQVLDFSPPLADKLALDTRDSDAEQIALRLVEVIRPDIYGQKTVAQLRQLVDSDSLQELRQEIDETRMRLEGVQEQLADFLCPVCGSTLKHRSIVPLDSSTYTTDYVMERYECGYESHDGRMFSPCPYQPDYPNPDDYEVVCSESGNGNWVCQAIPKTPMAKRVDVWPGTGRTRDQADAEITNRLPRRRVL